MVIGGGAFFSSPPKPIAQMAIALGLFSFFFFFFFHFLFLELLPLSQSLNGDWWRGLFSPSKPIAQMAVGGEEPFFCFCCPCKPIAEVRLVVRGTLTWHLRHLSPPYYNYHFLSVHRS